MWDSDFILVDHLDENAGITTNDSTRIGYNGTFNNQQQVSWNSSGRFGYALRLNCTGTTWCVSKGLEYPDMNMTTNFTIEAWIKLDENTTSVWHSIIAAKGGNSNTYLWWFLVQASDAKVRFQDSTDCSATRELRGNTPLERNKWYYLAVTYDSTVGHKLFINGKLDAIDSNTGTLCTNNHDKLRVGDSDGGLGYTEFKGLIDEFRISNKTRSADWINATYNKTLVTMFDEQGSSIANESDGRNSIELGINDTIPTSSRYPDQWIYIINSSGHQSFGKFDRVAVLGNQTWAFNYVTTGETATNMTNVSRTANIWESSGQSSSVIRTQVSNFITNTKW